MSWFDDRVVVDIVDDGRGFDPADVDEQQHFGLRGLRTRMTQIGGELTVDSEPGEGTTVALSAPLVAGVS